MPDCEQYDDQLYDFFLKYTIEREFIDGCRLNSINYEQIFLDPYFLDNTRGKRKANTFLTKYDYNDVFLKVARPNDDETFVIEATNPIKSELDSNSSIKLLKKFIPEEFRKQLLEIRNEYFSVKQALTPPTFSLTPYSRGSKAIYLPKIKKPKPYEELMLKCIFPPLPPPTCETKYDMQQNIIELLNRNMKKNISAIMKMFEIVQELEEEKNRAMITEYKESNKNFKKEELVANKLDKEIEEINYLCRVKMGEESIKIENQRDDIILSEKKLIELNIELEKKQSEPLKTSFFGREESKINADIQANNLKIAAAEQQVSDKRTLLQNAKTALAQLQNPTLAQKLTKVSAAEGLTVATNLRDSLIKNSRGLQAELANVPRIKKQEEIRIITEKIATVESNLGEQKRKLKFLINGSKVIYTVIKKRMEYNDKVAKKLESMQRLAECDAQRKQKRENLERTIAAKISEFMNAILIGMGPLATNLNKMVKFPTTMNKSRTNDSIILTSFPTFVELNVNKKTLQNII